MIDVLRYARGVSAVPNRIFVAIASYRDTECAPTVEDLFLTARRPDRISVGVFSQYDPSTETPRPILRRRRSQVRVETIAAGESGGACWAKRRALDLRGDEPYVLHIDSHMRFHPGWDDGLLEMLAVCPSPKAVLSAYPAPYTPPKRGVCQTPVMLATRFDEHGILIPGALDTRLSTPRRGAFLAGGFIFAPASFWDEVPYDPDLYFIGEEITLAVRAYTHGWDVYHPSICVIHHRYERPGVRHWNDHDAWTERNTRSVDRVRHLLGIELRDDPDTVEGLDGALGLGRARSLSEFERWADVDFRAQTFGARARLGEFGP